MEASGSELADSATLVLYSREILIQFSEDRDLLRLPINLCIRGKKLQEDPPVYFDIHFHSLIQ